jgi:beta-phosphoglucomutase-like phosphatase (HAD superfamily)
MKISPAVFIFDFDGVIVDSVTALYDTYDNFLQQYGHNGNQKEFDFLNGPKLADIITYLKEKYNLPPKEEELMSIYLDLLSSLYHRVNLYEGIEAVFVFIKERNYKIAIASSGKRKDIKYVLDKFNLSSYIDTLSTGDDVSEAKPSPEIYLLAKGFYPDHVYYVIEDSKNGLEAAHVAKTNTIFFNPDNRINEEHVLYEIHQLSEIQNIVEEFELNCFTLAKTSDISLNLVNYEPTFLDTQIEAIENIWNEHLKTKKLFNGKIVCYKSHTKSNNALSVDCFITEYKFFFAQLQNSELDLGIMPIGVSGIIIDKNENVMLGVRRNVTEYEGFYELAPSGGICSSKRKDEVILYEDQLIEELLEETEIKRKTIEKIVSFCFILDKNNGVYDICSKLHINKPLEKLLISKKNGEYKNFEIVSLKAAKSQSKKNDWVPTSRVILTNL